MRKPVKSFLLSSASFLIVTLYYPGLSYDNVGVLIAASAVFGLVSISVKPILGLLSLPLNLFTFGLFSFLIGTLLLYLVSFFVAGFSIVGFDFRGVDISGFAIANFFVVPLLAAIFASVLISWLSTALRWVFH